MSTSDNMALIMNTSTNVYLDKITLTDTMGQFTTLKVIGSLELPNDKNQSFSGFATLGDYSFGKKDSKFFSKMRRRNRKNNFKFTVKSASLDVKTGTITIEGITVEHLVSEKNNLKMKGSKQKIARYMKYVTAKGYNLVAFRDNTTTRVNRSQRHG